MTLQDVVDQTVGMTLSQAAAHLGTNDPFAPDRIQTGTDHYILPVVRREELTGLRFKVSDRALGPILWRYPVCDACDPVIQRWAHVDDEHECMWLCDLPGGGEVLFDWAPTDPPSFEDVAQAVFDCLRRGLTP